MSQKQNPRIMPREMAVQKRRGVAVCGQTPLVTVTPVPVERAVVTPVTALPVEVTVRVLLPAA